MTRATRADALSGTLATEGVRAHLTIPFVDEYA
jgi:hypothetical protein